MAVIIILQMYDFLTFEIHVYKLSAKFKGNFLISIRRILRHMVLEVFLS